MIGQQYSIVKYKNNATFEGIEKVYKSRKKTLNNFELKGNPAFERISTSI